MIVAAPFDTDHCRSNLVVYDLPLMVDFHDTGHRVPVFTCIEAADAVRKNRRQHRNDPVDEVDARTTGIGFLIDGRVGFDVPADIGNIDA